MKRTENLNSCKSMTKIYKGDGLNHYHIAEVATINVLVSDPRLAGYSTFHDQSKVLCFTRSKYINGIRICSWIMWPGPCRFDPLNIIH